MSKKCEENLRAPTTKSRKFRMVDVRCPSCGEREQLCDLNSEVHTCSECTEEVEIVNTSGAPMPLRASYHDGYQRPDDWRKLKEANKLKCEMYDRPVEKRGDISKEIRKLSEVKK